MHFGALKGWLESAEGGGGEEEWGRRKEEEEDFFFFHPSSQTSCILFPEGYHGWRGFQKRKKNRAKQLVLYRCQVSACDLPSAGAFEGEVQGVPPESP